jgi:hypothetical protein
MLFMTGQLLLPVMGGALQVIIPPQIDGLPVTFIGADVALKEGATLRMSTQKQAGTYTSSDDGRTWGRQ